MSEHNSGNDVAYFTSAPQHVLQKEE